MYESFFGLNQKPFNLTPDPRYFYLSESHREALAALVYGVHEKAGLLTLTGPVGVGKTMILASFLDQIKGNADAASFSGGICGISRSRIEFLKDLCRALRISPKQESLYGLSESIKASAVEKSGVGRSVVVLVDEAQDLSLEELDHIHHLSNLEARDAKLLQIILAGTEKLDEKLKDKRLEALWQRVAIRCRIEPIEPEETIAYIFHRMHIAGNSSPELFTDDALWRIANYSRGVPRLINLVCNQAMIAAYSSGKRPIDEDTVQEALQDIEGSHYGLETGEVVPREEIPGLVEVVSRRLVEEMVDSEGEVGSDAQESDGLLTEVWDPDPGGEPHREVSWTDNLPGLSPGGRLALTLGLVVAVALAGILITIGLPKPNVVEVKRLTEASQKQSGTDWAGDSPERTPLGYETPRGGPERSVSEIGPDALARNGREAEQHSLGESFSWYQALLGKEAVPVRQKDLSRIALEHYGRLDFELLRILRERNPQVRDWNNLDEKVQLVLPEAPQAKNGGADFYSVQVGAFVVEEGASKRASELAKRGVQNLFFVRGEGMRITFVCAGVFESGRQSSGSIRRMQEWGFDDAFPVRIQEKRLEDILQPYNASIAQKPE